MRTLTAALLALPLLSSFTRARDASAQEPASYERRRLATAESIGGVSCAATGRAYAEIYRSGALRECPLAQDTMVAGNALPAGTWILLDENGLLRSAWLPVDTRLGGQLCHGKGYKKFHVTFHGTGALRSCYLARDSVIEGVPCIHGSFWTEIRGGSKSVAMFEPDGTLAGCQLSRDAKLRGQPFRKWERWTRQPAAYRLSPIAYRLSLITDCRFPD